MSLFERFCDTRGLTLKASDWFARYCKHVSGYEPYLLSLDELLALYRQWAGS